MGIFLDLYAFETEPPSRQEIEQELSARMGAPTELFGLRQEGSALFIYCGLNPIVHAYTLKVLSDLGGTRLDVNTRRPAAAVLPDFVGRPWLQHDADARAAIEFEEMRFLGGEQPPNPPLSNAQASLVARLREAAVIRWPGGVNPQELGALKAGVARLPEAEQFRVLADPFLEPVPYGPGMVAQEYAGRLLIELNPPLAGSVADWLAMLLPGWDRSVEQLPLYFERMAGREAVLAALDHVDQRQPHEREKTNTVRYWLKAPPKPTI